MLYFRRPLVDQYHNQSSGNERVAQREAPRNTPHAQPCQISPGAPLASHAPAARRGAASHRRTDPAAHAHGDETAPARRDPCLTGRRLCAICGHIRYGHETMVEEWAEVL